MINFYRKIRAENCDIARDGDMLLFEWGIYDWGEGEMFEYSITRQFIFPTEFQLQAENRWCSSPSEIVDFRNFILSCEATRLVGKHRADRVELFYQQT